MRKTVEKKFRDLVYKHYPGLNLNKAYPRFIRYLIFGKKDKFGHSIIDQWHIAKAEEKEYLVKQNNYFAEKFLIKFQEEVMGIDNFYWTDWKYTKQEARVAIVKFPNIIEKAIEEERTKLSGKERVYFDTGKKFTKNLQKIDIELIKQEAFTYFDFCTSEAHELFEYMNSLPVNCFSKVIRNNLDETLIAAINIDDPDSRRVQIEILSTIRDELQPFYKPSVNGNTVRIFPLNYSIPMLRKDLRKIITKGWYEFDLASSQLAIAATFWNIKVVQDFLKSGKSIWKDLIIYYGIDAQSLKEINEVEYESIKGVLKDSLYALMYGMKKKNLLDFLNKGLIKFNIEDGGKKFFKHPILSEVYKARERVLVEINNQDSVETIFGKTLKVNGYKKVNGSPTDERSESIRSIMAQQAQAIEMYILLPVITLAKTTSDFQVTLWMHDGFSINFTNETKKDRWIKKIPTRWGY